MISSGQVVSSSEDARKSENEYARINRLLEEMSNGMGRSMEEIQSINSMMRMISFNSKIEAAKAGDAGNAFGIVSGEMKTLSEKTAEVAKKLKTDITGSIDGLQNISTELATRVRGTRLADLAFTNIDLIDRNLYERSCDVRWWATDPSLVDALGTQSSKACAFASKRLGVILSAYTVYYDLVLCDTSGEIIANGRPEQYRSSGINQSNQPWFMQAIKSSSGDDFGFQSVHASPLVRNERVLVYSCAVREGGNRNGAILGVLGILFNYDALAQQIMNSTPVKADLWTQTRVCIVDDSGLVLADSDGKVLQETLRFDWLEKLLICKKDYVIASINATPHCIAHARAPGYETYSTGWHSLIIQRL